MIILLQLSPLLHKNICYGSSLEVPQRDASNEQHKIYFTEKYVNLSQNYHHIPFLNLCTCNWISDHNL